MPDRAVTTNSSAAADRYDAEFDLVVLGSGASGMTAALVAAIEGARVLVLESTVQIGGTSARSSGTLWIPPVGDAAAAGYLDALVGDKADRSLREAFLAAGPAMIIYLERHAGFAFRPYPAHPDYRQDLPGAATGQRPLEPPAFDGRLLGADFERLGWPIRELMLFGGMMVTRGEAARPAARRSLAGALCGSARASSARFLRDRLRYRRGTRLVLGNALVARLLKSPAGPRGAGADRGREPLVCIDGRVAAASSRDVEAAKNRMRAGAASCSRAAAFRRTRPGARDICRRRSPRIPRPRRVRRQHDPARPRGRRRRSAPRAQDNALWFPELDRDPGGRQHRGLSAYRARPRQARPDRGRMPPVGASSTRRCRITSSSRAMYRTSERSGLAGLRPRLHPALRPRPDPAAHAEPAQVCRQRLPARGPTLAGARRAIGVAGRGSQATVRAPQPLRTDRRRCRFRQGRQPLRPQQRRPGSIRPNPCLGPLARPPFYAVRVEPTPLGTEPRPAHRSARAGLRCGRRADPGPLCLRQRHAIGRLAANIPARARNSGRA